MACPILGRREAVLMLSEAVVRRIVGTEGAEALVGITEGAWQDYIDEGVTRLHRSTRANVVWDYMAKRSDALLAGMDGVRRVVRHDRPMYVLRDRVVLRPKLHTRDTITRNFPTPAQIGTRKAGLFPEYDYNVISFGYQLDAAEAGIERHVITSPTDPWVINLQELADGDISPATLLLSGMEEDLAVIQPIRRQRSS